MLWLVIRDPEELWDLFNVSLIILEFFFFKESLRFHILIYIVVLLAYQIYYNYLIYYFHIIQKT